MSRIALIGENSVEYIRTLLDIWNSGNCAVLIDCKIPPQTIVEMIDEAGVEKCYVEQKYYLPIDQCSTTNIDLVPYQREVLTAQLLPNFIYERFEENYSLEEAIIIYSSGTTGKSKGIILSHFAISTNADAIIKYMRPSTEDCLYIVRNLTHSSTITGELLVALKTKTPILIAPVIMPPRYVLKNIAQYGITFLCLNPTLLSMLANEYRLRAYDISTLKTIYVSGSILDDKLYDVAQKTFESQKIYNVYGLTEAGPRVTAQSDKCYGGNSVGRCINGVEVAIVADDGSVLTHGAAGVVHVNSPSVFSGYVKGELKHRSMYKGWLNTGDIGYVDEHEELHIISRVDDLIIIDSHKIYPSEVEKHIQTISSIQECVVVLVEYLDNKVLCCMYVSSFPMPLDIKDKLGVFLMKYEIPKLYFKTEAIPRTPTGKIAVYKVKNEIIQRMKRKNKGFEQNC